MFSSVKIAYDTDPGTSMCSKLIEFTMMAIPAILCYITLYVQEITNLYFVAMLKETELIAAIGLANMIQNCIGISLVAGINQSMETFVS